jgi:hypothetical protein
MPSKLKPLVFALCLVPGLSWATVYSLSNMPNPNNLAAEVTPGQGGDVIQSDDMSTQVHLVRQGEGWSTGNEDANCNQDTGENCSFDDARDCQIAGQFNTCDVEVVVNGTYTTVNPNNGNRSCNSQEAAQQVSQQCSGLSITSGNGGWNYCQSASGGSWVMNPAEWDGSCPAGDNLLTCPSEYLGPGQIIMGNGYCYAFQWPGNQMTTINDGPAPWCGGGHGACNYDMAASGGCQTYYSGSCSPNVEQVTVNWGDGTTTPATYEYSPSTNQNNPSNVPIYIARHTYTQLPGGNPGSYPITVSEAVGGYYKTVVTYSTQVVWNLDYSGPGCNYYWGGTDQMQVSTSASGYSPGYLASIDYSPQSGFSGSTNITGSTQVCSTGCGNSGIGGGGDDLYPISDPCGSGQQVAYGQDIVLNPSTQQFSGGPLVVGNAWGWFYFQPDGSTVNITYNGASIGNISAQKVANYQQVLTGANTETQNLSLYVYRNTPPPFQMGQELASPTPASANEQ